MLQKVSLGPKSIDKYYEIYNNGFIDELKSLADDLKGLRLCHINSTPFGGGVAELLEVIAEGWFSLGVDAEVLIIEDVRLARHDIHPTRRAKRRRMAILEPNPVRRQCVEPGRRILAATVTAEAFEADIVRHHQHDVERLLLATHPRHRQTDGQQQDNQACDPVS